MIINIESSDKPNKRYVVFMDNGKSYHFGLKNAQTYIDHENKLKRKNYWARHYANEREKYLIDNLIASPSLFSSYILWGPKTKIVNNIDYLNLLWKQKHRMK